MLKKILELFKTKITTKDKKKFLLDEIKRLKEKKLIENNNYIYCKEYSVSQRDIDQILHKHNPVDFESFCKVFDVEYRCKYPNYELESYYVLIEDIVKKYNNFDLMKLFEIEEESSLYLVLFKELLKLNEIKFSFNLINNKTKLEYMPKFKKKSVINGK